MTVAELVEQAVGREGLLVDGRPVAAPGVAADRLVEVAVVVPLDEVDAVLGDEPAHRVEHVGERVRVREVEDVLPSRRQGHPGSRPHHPLGMRSHQVRVEVDHLGLEPETELHPETLDVLDQWPETLRPHRGRDLPVTEPPVVVAAVPEPAVVEDEPLDADRGTDVGEGREVVEVGLEVHRLPRVEDERPGRPPVPRLGALVVDEAVRDPVEARGGVHEDDRRRGIRLAGRQAHLPRCERLSPAEHRRVAAGTLGEPLDEVLVVAAPRDVGRPHLTGAEAEAGGPAGQEQGGVVSGAAAPAGP